jgi:hypothetical protein
MRMVARIMRFSSLPVVNLVARRRQGVCVVCLAPNRVRVLPRDAIVSIMLLKSNARGVRQVECDLSGRAPDEGARLR